jgi:hypothetical protein
MEQNIYQVMSAGPVAKKLIIECMGQPRNRMPVAFVACGKSPAKTFEIQTRFYICIVGYVGIIVVFDKLIVVYRPIYCDNCQDEKKAYQDEAISVGAIFRFFSILFHIC